MVNPYIYRCSLRTSIMFYLHLACVLFLILYKKMDSPVTVAIIAIAFSVVIFLLAVVSANSFEQMTYNVIIVSLVIAFIMHLVNEMFKSWRGL